MFVIIRFIVTLNVFWITIIVSIGDLLLLKIYYYCWKYVIQDRLDEQRFLIYVVNELQIS